MTVWHSHWGIQGNWYKELWLTNEAIKANTQRDAKMLQYSIKSVLVNLVRSSVGNIVVLECTQLERNLCRIDPIVPVIDPAEWHTGPFCQVYIAACERSDHYQTKVKPALQAFVSQIESAASNTAANQQGGHSADYLIVYVQINGRASTANK
ncbi:hypothetical protein IV203_030436 [Nitzschia inconspicua]|uniref:Uncharacterized protein n=1 Tax=Nitzschia inconspicua TaxID=303405 RepID=A0A9K3Q265_9STRA|nr:hypothetical protein IV203_025033 [Nitzschia inconspicua]KAG7339024.1 hypothetical protein IV203_028361 [Nitzschia inconspicua]KAG7339852.1 hypothetical protein IV203_024902 [Nitzschia inconspicua]KAG7367765.1 hypothetical protein IV203_030436 [Nitzschia inconspicua]